MKEVKFSYKSFFKTKTKKVLVPESISELNQEQYLLVMKVANNIGSIDDDYFLSILTGIPLSVLKKATDFEKYNLSQMFSFLSDDLPFREIKIKSFELNKIVYDGPTDFLSNISFLEFVFADTYFMRHMSGDEVVKYKLIACLYRRHFIDKNSDEFEGDTREKFSEHRIDKRAEEFVQLPHEFISGIIYNYRSIRQLIELRYVLLFPKMEDSETKSQKENSKKQNFNGWAQTFKKFVDQDLVNEDHYASMNAHRVLEVINNRIKENLKNG